MATPNSDWPDFLQDTPAEFLAVGAQNICAAWAIGLRAGLDKRDVLANHFNSFLFGPHGALKADGNSFRLKVLACKAELSPRIEVVSEPVDSQGPDVEPGISDELFELRLACIDRCLRGQCSLQGSLALGLQAERLIYTGVSCAQRGFGIQYLAALGHLWPQTVATLAPLGRAELINDDQCVKFRAALNYGAITAAYNSVAELQRVRRCSLEILDRTRTGLAAKMELRNDIIEISLGIKDASWVYLDRQTGQCRKRENGDWDVVPSLLKGSAHHIIDVQTLQLQIRELGCANINLPRICLQLDHQPKAATNVDARRDGSDHEWHLRVTDVGSPGRVLEALSRPFINIARYRETLCREFMAEVRANDKSIFVSYALPLPMILSPLVRFAQWWWSRQLQALDELRLLADLCEAFCADLAATVGGDPLQCSFFSFSTMYEDARSGLDWLEEYELDVNRRKGSCCRRGLFCCQRRRRFRGRRNSERLLST